MVVPEHPACIAFSDGEEEAERQIKLICTRLLLGWSNVKPSDMQVSRICGGISNLLVKVDPPAPLQAVAVKVFGDKTELLIDRDAEKKLLLRLNEVGFGAPVIGLFSNGRIEQFLTAKTLTPEEMLDPRFVPHIARRLRTFHDLQVDSVAAEGGAAGAVVAAAAAAAAAVGIPAASPAATPRADADATSPSAPATPPEQILASVSDPPSQWDAIYGWLTMAEGLSFAHDPVKQALYDKVDFRTMRAELATLRELCSRVHSPRVLCHNDLLSGNILVVQPQAMAQERATNEVVVGNTTTATTAGTTIATPVADDDVLAGGELQFIDFEYSCYGPRGFDWGNHFNEYAGFDCVYDRFPSPEQQKAFFRHYLKPGELQQLAKEHLLLQRKSRPGETAARPDEQQQQQQQQPQQQGATGLGSAVDPHDDFEEKLAAAEETVLGRLVAEACVFALASHAYWGVWSFIQARYSPIDFDYLDYSKMRWAEYYRRKEEFFAMVDRLFPTSQ